MDRYSIALGKEPPPKKPRKSKAKQLEEKLMLGKNRKRHKCGLRD